jgi:hypothetical protein
MWRLALLAPLALAGPDASQQPETSEHLRIVVVEILTVLACRFARSVPTQACMNHVPPTSVDC